MTLERVGPTLEIKSHSDNFLEIVSPPHNKEEDSILTLFEAYKGLTKRSPSSNGAREDFLMQVVAVCYLLSRKGYEIRFPREVSLVSNVGKTIPFSQRSERDGGTQEYAVWVNTNDPIPLTQATFKHGPRSPVKYTNGS